MNAELYFLKKSKRLSFPHSVFLGHLLESVGYMCASYFRALHSVPLVCVSYPRARTTQSWSLQQMCWEKQTPHAEERNWTLTLHRTQKSTQKGLKINVRPKTVKLLEENTEGKLVGVDLGNNFTHTTPTTGGTINNKQAELRGTKASAQQRTPSTQ